MTEVVEKSKHMGSSMLKYCFMVMFLALSVKQAVASSDDAFSKGDYDAAFREAYLSTVSGNKSSKTDLFILGKIYFEGLGSSEKDQNKAIKFLVRAIDAGDKSASLYLANQYEIGEKIEQNLVTSLQYYKKAQSLGEKNLEQKIASISSKISGSAITEENCREVVNAAKAQQENFYILAARCIAELQQELPEAQKFLEKKFSVASTDERTDIIKLVSSPTEALFAPAFAIKLASSLEGDNQNREDLFEIIYSEISGKITAPEFEKAVGALTTAYFNDDTIFAELAGLFEITTSSRNPTISNLAIDYLSNDLGKKIRQDDMLQIVSEILSSGMIKGEGKEKLIAFISDDASLFFAKNIEDNANAYSYVEQRLSKGICTPLFVAVQKKDFYSAITYTKNTSINTQCRDGDYQNLVAGFSNFPNSSSNKSLGALKLLCTEGLSNACFALGIIYGNNSNGVYSKVDAEQLALVSFENAFSLGSADAAVELSLIATAKGQKEKALELAKFAQEKGLIEGYYAEAYNGLKKLFSSSAKSCRTLNSFISQASFSNRFYEEAKLLQKKKRCGN